MRGGASAASCAPAWLWQCQPCQPCHFVLHDLTHEHSGCQPGAHAALYTCAHSTPPGPFRCCAQRARTSSGTGEGEASGADGTADEAAGLAPPGVNPTQMLQEVVAAATGATVSGGAAAAGRGGSGGSGGGRGGPTSSGGDGGAPADQETGGAEAAGGSKGGAAGVQGMHVDPPMQVDPAHAGEAQGEPAPHIRALPSLTYMRRTFACARASGAAPGRHAQMLYSTTAHKHVRACHCCAHARACVRPRAHVWRAC